MRTVFTLLILGLMTGTANSQDITLKGKITDRADKSGISGATIILSPAKNTTQVRLSSTRPVLKDSARTITDSASLNLTTPKIMDSLQPQVVIDTTPKIIQDSTVPNKN